jgi:hypothetical protein
MKSATLLLSLAMMTLWSWSGRAQENGERRRIRVIHEPSSSSSINGKQEKTPAAAGEQAAVQIQFGPSSDVRDVLRLYEMLTGQQVISTDQVKGPMPLTVTERVPKEQALALIEKALFAHGFTLINSPDLRTIQVTGPGQSPAQFPMPVFTSWRIFPQVSGWRRWCSRSGIAMCRNWRKGSLPRIHRHRTCRVRLTWPIRNRRRWW